MPSIRGNALPGSVHRCENDAVKELFLHRDEDFTSGWGLRSPEKRVLGFAKRDKWSMDLRRRIKQLGGGPEAHLQAAAEFAALRVSEGAKFQKDVVSKKRKPFTEESEYADKFDADTRSKETEYVKLMAAASKAWADATKDAPKADQMVVPVAVYVGKD